MNCQWNLVRRVRVDLLWVSPVLPLPVKVDPLHIGDIKPRGTLLALSLHFTLLPTLTSAAGHGLVSPLEPDVRSSIHNTLPDLPDPDRFNRIRGILLRLVLAVVIVVIIHSSLFIHFCWSLIPKISRRMKIVWITVWYSLIFYFWNYKYFGVLYLSTWVPKEVLFLEPILRYQPPTTNHHHHSTSAELHDIAAIRDKYWRECIIWYL